MVDKIQTIKKGNETLMVYRSALIFIFAVDSLSKTLKGQGICTR